MRRRRKKRCNPKRPTYRQALSAARKKRGGKRALAIFRAFTGIRQIPSIRLMGKKPLKGPVLVGLGRIPALTLSEGPKHRPGKQKRITFKGALLACDSSGRRLFVIRDKVRGLDFKGAKRPVGYAANVEYIMPRDLEKAGSFKRGTHWTHEMGESGGTWPLVKVDRRGNLHFGRSSLKVRKWLYR